ncbi:MAG: hypothetical protein IIX70_07845, partial [Oscillospiraceae bacterium]|nr:hypothetical protein [Oscillospiraceae bacterium]
TRCSRTLSAFSASPVHSFTMQISASIRLLALAEIVDKVLEIVRTHSGIYTVLDKSFPPQRFPPVLQYASIAATAENRCEEKLIVQNCKAPESDRFFHKTRKRAVVRLTPTTAL